MQSLNKNAELFLQHFVCDVCAQTLPEALLEQGMEHCHSWVLRLNLISLAISHIALLPLSVQEMEMKNTFCVFWVLSSDQLISVLLEAFMFTAILRHISWLGAVGLCTRVNCGKIKFKRLHPVFLLSSFPPHFPFLDHIAQPDTWASSNNQFIRVVLLCRGGSSQISEPKPCQLEDRGRITGDLKAVKNHFIPFISCLKLQA